MDELKPCPFCGGDPIMEVLGGTKSPYRTIRCQKCKCDMHYQPTEGGAIEAWNTRTPRGEA